MLPKDDSKPFDPLAYRLLLITLIFYQSWAISRLRYLQPWIMSWALPSMFGGIQGIGAVEAWHATSLDIQPKADSDGAPTSLDTLAALEKLASTLDPGPLKDAFATFLPAHRPLVEAWHADNAARVAAQRARQTPHALGTQARSSRPPHVIIEDRP